MKLSFYLFLSFFLLAFASILAQSGNIYVGAESCGMCHKSEKQGSQLSIWQNSAHSKAFETLKTDTANQIVKEKGFTKPASETWECLKCHVTGYNLDATMLGTKFKIEDGVQCETCHGAGSAYKEMKIMKDKNLAISNGLIVHDDLEEFCVSCHNSESPTFVKFDVSEAWDKIKHNVPKENK
ncbi:MAG: cytochrome C554 [Ignavibacteria bacterium RBG_16_36_9]|nr:MAG: cytochrome C554 [Ignavibacteria bacterium RBG_16_36_9]